MFRIFWLVLISMCVPVVCAEPFWGSKVSQPVDTDPQKLKAGQFIWNGDHVTSGAVVALVSIPTQRIYLYRNGSLIGISTVSTGKRGYGTPAGLFTVVEKDRYHRSRTYDNAPMPYANRLTWEGVALHAGHVLSYPASHGCIRLPSQFARHLFSVSTLGMTVVVVGYQNDAVKLARPNPQLSDIKEDRVISLSDLSSEEEFRWQPDNALEGEVSIVLSEKDQHLFVYRNGIEIGRSKISMTLSEKHLGTHAFMMQEGEGIDTEPFLSRRWQKIGTLETVMLNADFFDHLDIPKDIAKAIHSILTPNTTLVVTNSPMLPQQRKPTRQARCLRGNCVHGQGIQVYADGSKYIGQFKNGLSEGQGQLFLPNGEKYVGTFKDDKYQWN